MVTCPITTDHFHSRVLSLLSASLAQPQKSNHPTLGSGSFSSISISQLSPLDTPLTPDQSTSQIIATTSSWIDLGSPDPIIADLSRQILKLELTYAAFCGVTYVLVAAPRSSSGGTTENGLIQYARTILDALQHGPYMQIHIWVPMIEHFENDGALLGDLAAFVRQEYQIDQTHQTKRLDIFGSWAAWNVIRSMCKYHTRLCVGKLDKDTFILFYCFSPILHLSCKTNLCYSTISSQVPTSGTNSVSVVLGACSNLHPALRYLLQERKGLSSLIKATSSFSQPLHEIEKSSVVPALRGGPITLGANYYC